MKQYKHSLDKSSKKFICPRCHKKTFVKFIDIETECYLEEEYGRCDRETNCGYFNIPTAEKIYTFEKVTMSKPKISYHGLDLVNKMYAEETSVNNFTEFLKTKFKAEKVFIAMQKYLITASNERWQGATVFWQIDNLEKVHAGKILHYNPEKGKRMKDKNNKSSIDWIHSLLKKNQSISEFNLGQCLFGLHLINEDKTNKIALVESEKTAVIMSILKPNYTWLATGSKSGLKYDFLKPVKDYKIAAFPDKGEYSDWLYVAIELNKLGFRILVDDWLENTDYPIGTDLADVYINEILAEPPPEKRKPKQEHEFSEGSLEVYEIIQRRKEQKQDLTKEESYKAIQYFIDNDTDKYIFKSAHNF
ncbi:DUF6371 domain-containing protein [Flavobacterium sp. GNP001]